ncbi:sec-independent translocase [Streptomyces sp. NPDC002490]|uniref:sec-independent translocase n=1 Tax=Streptomyces sp. NPDC002490 TaxID=3154416 RepID=UPI003316A7F2
MFNDIGWAEVLTIVVLGMLVLGPERLPKAIQDISRTIRKIREFSDSAKEDIRTELGPEFKDFEFEDLNPKTYLRKQLGNDDLGLQEIRNSFDLRKEMAELSDSVNGYGDRSDRPDVDEGSRTTPSGAPGRPDLVKKRDLTAGERPPYDIDAT